MGQARHLLSLLLAVAAVMLATGCGSSDDGSRSPSSVGPTPAASAGATTQTCAVGKVAGAGRIRVSGVRCTFARGIVAAWYGSGECSETADGSRVSCLIGDYRCLGATTDRGLAVSCAVPGHSISFVAKRG
jgi:hypothetical protein